MSKAVKFGGSSVANSEQFKKVKQIILADPDRKYVVTSACGKSGQEDHKVTDLLYLCAAHITYDVSYESIFQSIVDKYMEIKRSLGLKIDLGREFAKIRQNLAQNLNLDYLVSRGEYLTGLCLAEYLDADFVDASRVIRFHYDGSIDLDKCQELLKAQVDPGRRVVIPGFYGSLPNGVIKVMSRGRSDITGSIVANAFDVDVYENWTDVSGFYVADPRIIKDPVQIPRITYSELRQMSYMGANVLHDDAVFPVRQKNIPINVCNTNHPENPGTMIMNDCSELDKRIRRMSSPGLRASRTLRSSPWLSRMFQLKQAFCARFWRFLKNSRSRLKAFRSRSILFPLWSRPRRSSAAFMRSLRN